MRQFITLLFFTLLGFSLFSCDKEAGKPKPKDVGRSIPKQEIKYEPKVTSFHIQYHGELDCKGRDVAYLDMYNYNPEDIKKCRESGTKLVIGYFSSQWSSWYPDSGGDCLGHGPDTCYNKFTEEMLGEGLPHWKGERFVDPTSKEVRKIMMERIHLAKQKGFDGIDVDNTDFYHFDTGFDLDKKDSIDYLNFFIKGARDLGMIFSLKNSMDVMNDIFKVQLYQNESCYKYNECKVYDSVDAPVFIISYKRRCPKNLYKKAYTILKKKMNQKDKACQ